MTREEWLEAAIKEIEPLFTAHKYKVPKVRVSVGLPHGRGAKKAIGQHWSPEATDDKVSAIFISPTIMESLDVLETVAHELIHAIHPKDGHGPAFKKCAVLIGFMPPMRSTPASDGLKRQLTKVIKTLGKYPHSKLNLAKGPVKKQTTRMIKMTCQSCEYIARASLSKIIECGPVICPCNAKPMFVDIPDEDLL